MATNSKVNWYGEDVKLLIKDAKAEIVESIAFLMEGQIKANIAANNQIDTGFMFNSPYVVLPNDDTYAQARAAAKAKNPNGELAPQVSLPDDADAAVVVGANYSIYQEIKNSFIFRAVEQIAGRRTDAEIKRVARKKDLRS